MKIKSYFTIITLTAFVFLRSSAQVNKSLSNLSSPTAINQSLLPNASNAKDLGSSSFGWRDIYLSNRLYLNGSLTLHSPGTGNFFAGGGTGNTALSGTYNTGSGYYSLSSLTTGYSNTANGSFALNSNSTGFYNTAVGGSALANNTSGHRNTAIGASAMNDNETGSYNTATGYYSLFSNTTGVANTAYGSNTLISNTVGYNNTANGYFSLYSNTSGFDNTATGGGFALYANTTGYRNTANGSYALHYNTAGYSNTAIGYSALYSNTTGFFNTALGLYADVASGNLTYATAIGTGAIADASYKVRIGNTFISSIGGQVGWSIFSDGRYKRNIKENVAGLAFINSLRPVSYTVDVKGLNAFYDKERKHPQDKINEQTKAEINKAAEDASNNVHVGFVAQEVEGAAKKLGFEFDGVDKPKSKDGLYGLRYDNFVVPLVKAVQELSKISEELRAKNDSLQQEVTELKLFMLKGNQNTSHATINTSLTDASLEQNAPNPFAGATTIRYTLPQKFTTAQIIITDKSGKTIKQLNISGAGKGAVNVETSALSGGTYNYSLIVDGKIISTKQMILAK